MRALLVSAQQPAPATPPADPAVAAGQGPGRGQRGGRGPGRGAPRVRKTVLAWADTRNGMAQHDSVSHALAVIERLGYESGAYDTYIRTDSNIISKTPQKTTGEPASGGPNLNNVDAIFFMGHRDVPLDDQQKADLLSFVRDDGKGFVAAHVGLTAFESWPEFGELIGARFDGHPMASDPGRSSTRIRRFPATKHLPADVRLHRRVLSGRRNTHGTRSTCCCGSTCRTLPPTRAAPTDRDYPLAWAKMYGKGRVFYGSFAHAPSTWDIRDVQQMYFEAMQMVAGYDRRGPEAAPDERCLRPNRRGSASPVRGRVTACSQPS